MAAGRAQHQRHATPTERTKRVGRGAATPLDRRQGRYRRHARKSSPTRIFKCRTTADKSAAGVEQANRLQSDPRAKAGILHHTGKAKRRRVIVRWVNSVAT